MKCVIFDMDGVLLDSEPLAFEEFRKSLELIGIKEPIEDLLQYVGDTSLAAAEGVLKKHHTKMSAEEFLKFHRTRGSFYEVSDKVKPMKGLVEFLQYLADRGVQMAVVSSSRCVSVITALNRMKILKYFDTVVTFDMISEPKPSPQGYLKARDLLEASNEQCLIIEDSPIGIRAAKNAGMRVVGYKGSVYRQDTSEADMEAGSFSELRRSRFLEDFLKR